MLFSRKVDVGDVDKQMDFLSCGGVFLHAVQHMIPILGGEAVPRRVVRRRIEDDEQALLLLEECVNRCSKCRMVEVVCLIKELEVCHRGAEFLTDDIVRSPEPI